MIASTPASGTALWSAYERYVGYLFTELGHVPNEAQEPFHLSISRLRLIAGGERAGKSLAAGMDGLARSAFTVDGKRGQYWIVGPDYVQTRAEFEYIWDAYQRMGYSRENGKVESLSTPEGVSNSWVLRLSDGTTWETKTSADIRKLASKALDGVVMSEAAQQSYDVFLKLRGRISERRGWLTLSGTFEQGLPWYAQLYDSWQAPNVMGGESFSLPSWSNTAIYPGGENDPEILALKATYPEDLFLERFAAIPCKPFGLVFREFDYPAHVSDIETADIPVALAIDPGYAGAYAVLALQTEGPLVNVIDEVYGRYATAHEIIAECRERDWWDLVPKLSVGKSWGVIDQAGKQHQGLPSHVEIWRQEADVSLRHNPVSIEDGILCVRVLLKDPRTGEPRITFAAHMRSDLDAEGHPLGILGELRKYRYPPRREDDLKRMTDQPVDKYNHALKALGYWSYDTFGPVGERKPQAMKIKRTSWH